MKKIRVEIQLTPKENSELMRICSEHGRSRKNMVEFIVSLFIADNQEKKC